MLRRHFLEASLVLPVTSAALVSGCHRVPKKEQVLQSLAEDVMVTGIRAAVAAALELQRAVSQLAAAPSVASTEAARSAWVRAALSCKRANACREQSFVASSELVRAAFWPPRPRAIDDLVVSDASLADSEVDKLGADLRSLYAMEYLLFAEGSGSPIRLDAPESVRARDALVAFAGSVVRRAQAVEKALGLTPVAAQLGAQGQDGVNQFVAIAVGNIESFVANRLATVVWIASTKKARSVEVEGGPSGISHLLAAAVLEVTAHMYEGEHGAGLAALVAAVAPAAHERVRSALAVAVAGIKSFSEPLERVALADPSRIEALLKKCKALEVALRSDLASALGVTLTFTSADAD